MQIQQIKKTVATVQLYSFIHADLIFPLFCLKQYAIGLLLNHFRHKKKYTLLIGHYPPIDSVLSHMVVVFSFCLSLESILFWLLSPHAGSRGSNSPPSYNWLSTHLLGTASLSLSLAPSVLSFPPYPSLSFSYANVLSCSQKNPCSTSCCRSRLAGCLISCRSSCFSSFSSCFCSSLCASFPSSSVSDSHLTHFTSLVLSHF